MRLPFPIRRAELLELEPFVVATRANAPYLDTAPFGAAIAPHRVYDPTRVETSSFLRLLERLDAATFGPEGMPMPRWVFYDCSELPGAIFGFGLPGGELCAEDLALYGLDEGFDGFVPLSMYIAIPMHPRGAWFGHNLASLGRRIRSRKLAGLGSLTKALGLRVFGARRQYGATQWDSTALFIHTRFGPLQLETAVTPVHSEPGTLTYWFDVTDEALRSAAGDPSVTLARPEPDEWVCAADTARLDRLQDAIERGERWCIPARPRSRPDGGIEVPLARTL